ncbi:P pilus assembly chaperone PapD [Pseudomonas nitritireducens]|uniref:P pilus assembly chaperone PapD n=1 Tax=Pseudomonas nitroreducens TaxID=46680 RepID=A0A7W7KHQ3_PSENT|nr:fimbria/pilus periplasmic chaperone [Pseudomonas nitritireducens]MBB4862308.1 P pilus assembly chaperone PapD [Pseudomonas nitritireducens]
MKRTLLCGRAWGLLVAACLMIAQAQASIVITGTRVVYDASQREVTVKLSNDGQSPMLVQSWIDEGNVQATPDTSAAPFVLTPPIARIDPSKGQALRIRYTGQKVLPQDSESLFWLNVLEVPPSSAEGQNRLKIAFRSRVKLFYRPAGLPGNVTAAAEQLQWRLRRNGPDWALECRNDSPYYVTLGKVSVSSNGQTASPTLDINSSMLAPGEQKMMPLKNSAVLGSGGKVDYTSISDLGATIEHSQSLKP